MHAGTALQTRTMKQSRKVRWRIWRTWPGRRGGSPAQTGPLAQVGRQLPQQGRMMLQARRRCCRRLCARLWASRATSLWVRIQSSPCRGQFVFKLWVCSETSPCRCQIFTNPRVVKHWCHANTAVGKARDHKMTRPHTCFCTADMMFSSRDIHCSVGRDALYERLAASAKCQSVV